MKKKNFMIPLAILAAAMVIPITSVLSPMVAVAAKAFPDTELSWIQMLITLPSLISLPVGLLAGKLADRYSNKKLTAAGLVFYLAGGVGPVFLYSSIEVLLFWSVISGIGLGIMHTMSSVLVTNFYTGEERGKMMGYTSVSMSITGTVLASVCGKLAAVKWNYAYFIFWIIIPVLLVFLVCLPEQKNHHDNSKNDKKNHVSKKKALGKQVVFYCLFSLIFSMLIYAFNTNIAILIEKKGLGDASVAGTVTSAFNLIGIFIGLCVGKIIAKVGKMTFSLAFGLAGVGLLLAVGVNNIFLMMIAAVVIGIGFAVRGASGYYFAAEAAPGAAAMAIAYYSTSTEVGKFLSPWLLNLVTENTSVKFIFAGVLMLVMAVVAGGIQILWEKR